MMLHNGMVEIGKGRFHLVRTGHGEVVDQGRVRKGWSSRETDPKVGVILFPIIFSRLMDLPLRLDHRSIRLSKIGKRGGERKINERKETFEIDIPENLKKDVKKFIEDRPELGFKSVDEFISRALSYFLEGQRVVKAPYKNRTSLVTP